MSTWLFFSFFMLVVCFSSTLVRYFVTQAESSSSIGDFSWMSWIGDVFLDGQYHTGLNSLDQVLWKHPGSKHTKHMDGVSQFLAVADGTLLAPAPLRQGSMLLSGSIPSPLLWFPSAPFFRGDLSLSNQWRLPFPVFKHGYADNCILILLLVILIHLEQKSSASAQLSSILIVKHQFL